jgi:hypothetical protein
MTFQTIIDTAQNIEIDRRRVVGQTISRSQRIKTQQRQTAQPFSLTVSPQARFKYGTNRSTFEGIMSYDRNLECEIKLGSNSNLAYLTEYQGQLTSAQRSAMTITNFTLTSVTIGSLPAIGSTVTSATIVLAAGDYIQPQNSRYPYIVQNTVLRGSGSVVTATVHRKLITSEAITVTGPMKIGTETSLTVIAQKIPTLVVVQKNWAQYNGDFVFVEKII